MPYFISAGVFASCVGHVAKTVRGLALPSLGAVSGLQSHDDPHSCVQGACMGGGGCVGDREVGVSALHY